MQQQVPIRNYVYFLVSVLALVYGWSWLRPKIFPPPPVVEKLWAYNAKTVKEQREIVARLLAAPTGLGLVDALSLTGQYLAHRDPPKPAPPQWRYEFAHPAERVSVAARAIAAFAGGSVGDAAAAEAAFAFSPQLVARFADDTRPGRKFVLGGPRFAITASLTDRGAGVKELVLNDFPMADSLGLPVKNADGTARPIDLIPEITSGPPAFAVFHYERPDDEEPRPLDTLGRSTWTVERYDAPADGPQTVVFSADVPDQGVRIVKTFTLAPHEYHLGLTVKVERLGGTGTRKFRYQLAGAHGLPIEGVWYATMFRSAMIGLVDNADAVYRVALDSRALSHSGGSDRYRRDGKRIAYAAVAVQFFASAIAVDDAAGQAKDVPPALQFVRATIEGQPNAAQPFLDDITVRAIAEPVELGPGQSREHTFVLYHGPVKVRQLSQLRGAAAVAPELVDRYADTLHLKTLTDYGSFGFWTDLIILFTNLIHRLVGFLLSMPFMPAGLAIVCVTIIVRLCMFPVSFKQAKSMQRMQERMQKLAPEMKEIDRKYRDDFMAKRQAQSDLYRRHGVNPAAGLGGCLMLILQMPIFMGLYYALQESVFFRLKPFLWIRNLTAPDMLMWWGQGIPGLTSADSLGSLFYVGPFLNLLPLIGAALIFIQQKASMPKEMTEEQRQQFTMMKYMTFMMAFMFYKVPAGLSLYFIASSAWGLTERALVKRHLANVQKNAPPDTGTGRNGAKLKPKTPPPQPTRLRAWWDNVLKEASKK